MKRAVGWPISSTATCGWRPSRIPGCISGDLGRTAGRHGVGRCRVDVRWRAVSARDADRNRERAGDGRGVFRRDHSEPGVGSATAGCHPGLQGLCWSGTVRLARLADRSSRRAYHLGLVRCDFLLENRTPWLNGSGDPGVLTPRHRSGYRCLLLCERCCVPVRYACHSCASERGSA